MPFPGFLGFLDVDEAFADALHKGRHAGPDECQMFNPAAALLAKDKDDG